MVLVSYCLYHDLIGAFNGIWNHKNTSIWHYQAIRSLLHTVHNVQFAKSQEKPHIKAKRQVSALPLAVVIEKKAFGF